MSETYIPVSVRRLVRDRAFNCCEYCLSRADFLPGPMCMEHILPESSGGPSIPDNLALACHGCNGFKGARQEAIDPLSGEGCRLFNPRVDDWSANFVWNGDCTEILGLTPIGRATVVALKLNRSGLVNLRRILFLNGLHPPVFS